MDATATSSPCASRRWPISAPISRPRALLSPTSNMPGLSGSLSDAGDPRHRARRLHQHRADRCISRRRTAGGALSPRTQGSTRRRARSASIAELRRRNMVTPAELPFRTRSVSSTTAGDLVKVPRYRARRADWRRFAERRAASTRRGLLRASVSAITPSASLAAGRKVPRSARSSGKATALLGTMSTVRVTRRLYAQNGSPRVRPRPRRGRVGAGRHRRIASGHARRLGSIPIGGAALDIAMTKVIAQAHRNRRPLLETAEADIDSATAVHRRGHRPRSRSRWWRRPRTTQGNCRRNGAGLADSGSSSRADRLSPMAAISARSRSTPRRALLQSCATPPCMIRARPEPAAARRTAPWRRRDGPGQAASSASSSIPKAASPRLVHGLRAAAADDLPFFRFIARRRRRRTRSASRAAARRAARRLLSAA